MKASDLFISMIVLLFIAGIVITFYYVSSNIGMNDNMLEIKNAIYKIAMWDALLIVVLLLISYAFIIRMDISVNYLLLLGHLNLFFAIMALGISVIVQNRRTT